MPRIDGDPVEIVVTASGSCKADCNEPNKVGFMHVEHTYANVFVIRFYATNQSSEVPVLVWVYDATTRTLYAQQ